MGKINSLISFTGKVGQNVGMKGMKGETYIRMKVDPKNPNTQKQVEQRTKMSLAGQLSKMTPSSLIYGMGENTRNRRTNFVKTLLKNATISSDENMVQAAVKPEKLVFSKGLAYPVSDLTAAMASGTLTVTKGSALPEDLAAIIVVVAFTDAVDRATYVAIDQKTISGSTLSVTFAANGSDCNVYYIPVMKREGASSVDYQIAVDNIAATHSYAAQAELMTSGLFNYGQSEYLETVDHA